MEESTAVRAEEAIAPSSVPGPIAADGVGRRLEPFAVARLTFEELGCPRIRDGRRIILVSYSVFFVTTEMNPQLENQDKHQVIATYFGSDYSRQR